VQRLVVFSLISISDCDSDGSASKKRDVTRKVSSLGLWGTGRFGNDLHPL
jgi:hypothetical protein